MSTEERLLTAVIEGDWLRWVNSESKPDRRAISFTAFRAGYLYGHRRATGKIPKVASSLFYPTSIAVVCLLVGLALGLIL